MAAALDARKIFIDLQGSQKLSKEALASLSVEIARLQGNPRGLSLFLDLVKKANEAASLLDDEDEVQPKKRLPEAQRIMNTLRSNAPWISHLQQQVRSKFVL